MLFHRVLLFPRTSPSHTRRNNRSRIIDFLCHWMVQTPMDIFHCQCHSTIHCVEGARLEILFENLLCHCHALRLFGRSRKWIALFVGDKTRTFPCWIQQSRWTPHRHRQRLHECRLWFWHHGIRHGTRVPAQWIHRRNRCYCRHYQQISRHVARHTHLAFRCWHHHSIVVPPR